MRGWIVPENHSIHEEATPKVHLPYGEQIDELQQLYDRAPCGYHSLDQKGVFVRINQTELTMLGYSHEEIVGKKKFSDLLTPESQQTFQSNFSKFKRQGWIRDLEFQMLRKDGTILPVSLSSTAVKDDAGIFFMSRSVVMDISEAKRDEVVRKKVEQERERFLSVGSDLQIITGSDGYFHWVSPSFEHTLGWIPEEMKSCPWSEFIHPEDLQATHTEATNLLAGSETFAFEHRMRHKDGSYRWLLWKAQSYPGERLIYGAAVDITDRKLYEQKIQEQAALLDITTDAIFVHDLDNRILFWSKGAETLYGWQSKEMLSQDWRHLLSQEARSEMTNILQTVLEQGMWQGEVKKITQTDDVVVVMSRRSLMLDEAGQPKSILIVDTDIAEKKQLETQFLRAQRLESLGTMASGIAHDLNNVLTPIIGIVQLLPQKVPHLDDQTKRLLDILNESTHRGAGLVKQILSFTRGVEGNPTNTQVNHLLKEVYKIIQQTFPKTIELSPDFSPDLWLIPADATLLHQVFMNLCVNARDAMPHGGMLSISAENVVIDNNYARMHVNAQAGFYVVVTISDTGTGIPPKILDSIFDPFFTTKAIGQGTGLGLSTVLGIVKSHRGFINVYSEVAKGTRFKIYLPATKSSEIETVAQTDLPLGQGELILVVDDEVAIREITQITLETSEYRVLTASDGIEAIALYAEHKDKISVVLLDLMMPELDSVTIIRTLQKLNPQVQIVAMSGLATNEATTKVLHEGVQCFLAKPFTAPELLNLLPRLCSGSSTTETAPIPLN
jgi:PAS domain S-box-containing protein